MKVCLVLALVAGFALDDVIIDFFRPDAPTEKGTYIEAFSKPDASESGALSEADDDGGEYGEITAEETHRFTETAQKDEDYGFFWDGMKYVSSKTDDFRRQTETQTCATTTAVTTVMTTTTTTVQTTAATTVTTTVSTTQTTAATTTAAQTTAAPPTVVTTKAATTAATTPATTTTVSLAVLKHGEIYEAMSEEDKALCDRYADEVIAIVNRYRAQEGLSQLAKMTELSNCSFVRVEETTESFSHVRPDGTRFFTVYDECGVSEGRSGGENIAYGYPTPELVMEALMSSEGHKANILTAKFDYIGVGVVIYEGLFYWEQIFVSEVYY